MSSALQRVMEDPSKQTIATSKPRWELKKLSQKHKTIVALHAQGVDRHDIGGVAGCTPEYVSMIVAQPLAQAYLADLERYMDSRLKTLYGRSVDAIADGLDSGNEEVKLKAARLQMEATGKLKGEKKETQSAEDVVAAILSRATVIIGQNVQVNQGDNRGQLDSTVLPAP